MRGLILALAVSLAGCVSAGQVYEGDFKCKGKVALTITGNLQIGAGYGGGGSNAASVVGDCGEGFEISRTRKAEEPSK